MTVQELRQTAGERYEMLLYDGTKIKTTLSVVAEFSLYTGRELGDEELKAVISASELGRCKDRAMRIIGARAMSQRELYDRLIEKGESEENAAAALAWLVELRFMDDMEYAAMLVRHYSAKGYGKNRVRDELYRHKVPRMYWDEALEQMPEQDDTIDRLLRRKLKSSKPDRAELKKTSDALLRRGFSWEEIRSAISRYNSNIEEDD